MLELGKLTGMNFGALKEDMTQSITITFDSGTDFKQVRRWDIPKNNHKRLLKVLDDIEVVEGASLKLMITAALSELVEGTDVKPGANSLATESFTPNDIEIIKTDVLHDRWFKLIHYVLKYRRFDGDWSQETEHYVTDARHGVAVVLYDPATSNIGLIEEFRCGAIQTSNPWVIHTVTGGMEDGESPESSARRECCEEVGIQPDDLIPLGIHWPSPSHSNVHVHLFAAICDLDGKDGQVNGLAEENEDIKLHVMPIRDALDKVSNGTITSSNAVIALYRLRDEFDLVLD